jgi:hypothetical protein
MRRRWWNETNEARTNARRVDVTRRATREEGTRAAAHGRSRKTNWTDYALAATRGGSLNRFVAFGNKLLLSNRKGKGKGL